MVPKIITKFWTQKINANKARDQRNIALLEEQKWNVITVWECELKKNTVKDTYNCSNK